jgi:hypothetical protein
LAQKVFNGRFSAGRKILAGLIRDVRFSRICRRNESEGQICPDNDTCPYIHKLLVSTMIHQTIFPSVTASNPKEFCPPEEIPIIDPFTILFPESATEEEQYEEENEEKKTGNERQEISERILKIEFMFKIGDRRVEISSQTIRYVNIRGELQRSRLRKSKRNITDLLMVKSPRETTPL